MKLAALVLAVAVSLPQAGGAQTVPEPDGYRMEDYRAPVPASLAGATVIGPEQAFAMWKAGEAGFIDVMPQPPRPANLPEGTIWREKPRESIPGAVWLPNVGYGAIAEITAEYFRAGMEEASGGDPALPVVIFCLADCWMSWNAAKRAIEWGYSDVYWFPEGTDGWRLWNYPLDRVEPMPGQPQTGE